MYKILTLTQLTIFHEDFCESCKIVSPLENVSKAVLPILHIYRKLQNVQVERVLITASVHQNGSPNQSFAEPRRETGYKFLRLPVSPVNACLISTCDRSKRHPLRPLLHTVHFTAFFQSERRERCSAQ